MLRAFTRDSQEENNTRLLILNFPMSIYPWLRLSPCVTNILKTMSTKPRSGPGQSWSAQPLSPRADIGGRKHLCAVSGQGPGGAWRRRGQTSAKIIIVSLGGSKSPPATHFILPGARGRGANENKTPQCSLPAACAGQMLAVEHILIFYLRWVNIEVGKKSM